MDPEKLRSYLEDRMHTRPADGARGEQAHWQPGGGSDPVHLYGQMADMDPILALATQYNFIVIEDACQAHGAEYLSTKEDRWRKAGSMGRAAAFSFYPGKNLGACGEAGAVTTDDERLGAALPDAARPRPVDEVRPRHQKATTVARRHPGGYPAHQAPVPGEVERPTPRERAPLRRAVRGRRWRA